MKKPLGLHGPCTRPIIHIGPLHEEGEGALSESEGQGGQWEKGGAKQEWEWMKALSTK